MATIKLTEAEIQKVKDLQAAGKLSEAWKILGEKGDSYAFLASNVLSKDVSSLPPMAQFFHFMVRLQWENTVGVGVWGTPLFESVGKAHLGNYINLLLGNPVGDSYILPSTLAIEASYKDALIQNFLPPQTAVDSLFSVIDTAWGRDGDGGVDFSWAEIMGLANAAMGGPSWPGDRIVYNSTVFVGDIDATEAAITLGRIIIDATEATKAQVVLPLPFQPLFWVLGAFDSLIDFTTKDYGYHFAVTGLCQKLGMEIDRADYLLSIVDDDEHAAFAALIDKFGKLTIGTLPPSDSTRIKLFENAIAINNWLKTSGQGLEVKLIDDIPASSIIASAQSPDGIAWRYALKELNPFIFLGNISLYDKHNGKGELDLFDLDAGAGTLSKEWIEDRTAMLSWIVKLNKEDFETLISRPYSMGGVGNVYFEDVASGEKIYLGSKRGLTEDRRHFIFGSDDADHGITGGSMDDRLYGMDGNDQLNGKRGNDWLEGGKGTNDVYVFRSVPGSRDGSDTIVDIDGGFIKRDTKALATGEYDGLNQWKAADGTIYLKSGKDLVVSFTNGDRITIKSFDFDAALTDDLPPSLRHRSFGIELDAPPKVAIVEGVDLSTNPARAEVVPVVTASMSEGGSQMFTVFVSDASSQSRTITISLSGVDVSEFALSIGGKQFSLDGGSVVLTLKAGETHISFSLLNNGDVDTSGLLSLTALLKGLGGVEDVESNLANIDFNAIEEESAGSFVNHVTDGDDAHSADNTGVDPDVTEAQGSLTGRAWFSMGGGSDLVQHGNSSDEIHGGSGNDLILATGAPLQAGEQLVHGDAGNDWIQNSGGGGKLYGDGGNDAIGQLSLATEYLVIQHPEGGNGNPFKAKWDNVDICWQAVSKFWSPKIEAGTLTQDSAGIGFGGGSWYKDANDNRILLPQAKLQASGGSFVSADGYTYRYTFTPDSDVYFGMNGTLLLSWEDAGYKREAKINIHELDYTAPQRPGNALMDGGVGDDCIVGADAGNTLVGGAGNDLIQGGAGVDMAYGDGGPASGLSQSGAGKDQMALGGGNDYADGGDDDDIVIGEDGADSLFGGRGNDVLVAGKWSHIGDVGNGDYLDGGDDNDKLYGSGNNDTLMGGDGDDFLLGEWESATSFGNDYLDGGDGNDEVRGEDGSDILIGGKGNDVLVGDVSADPIANEPNHGDDKLYGGEGNDQMWGDGGNDMLFGGIGEDRVDGGFGDDLLEGGADSDALFARDGNDVLSGGTGTDYLDGGVGDDVYVFEAGDSLRNASSQVDTIVDQDGANIISFGAGIRLEDVQLTGGSVLAIRYTDNDSIVMYASTLPFIAGLQFANGTFLSAQALYAMLPGLSINGDIGDDTLTGFGGNDVIHAGTGNDTIDGGGGNDDLYGGEGANTYLFGRGSGQDRIINPGWDPLGVTPDTLIFKEGVASTDVSLSRSGDDLMISINGTDDQITILGQFGVYADFTAVQYFRFYDETLWDSNTIRAMLLVSTEGNDVLTGYAGADTIVGGNGNDTLSGLAGKDRLKGDAGRDKLDGGADADNVQGGQGDDYLMGGDGNDTLDGGADNDSLIGGLGADTFLFGYGSGQDRIEQIVEYPSGGQGDAIQLGAGITVNDVILSSKYPSDLVISLKGSNDQLIVSGFFNETADWTIDSIRFADGTVWTLAQIKTIAWAATAGDDYLIGDAGNNNLRGNEGDDNLYGRVGNDTLRGDTGKDVLDGGTGDDILYGDAGDDELTDWSGSNVLDGGSGMDRLSGSGSLYGGAGNDYLDGYGSNTLDGGAGNDHLRGHNGSTTYVFGRGSGRDEIINQNADPVGTNPDRILLGTGISTSDVLLEKIGSDLLLSIKGTSDSVQVTQYFAFNGTSTFTVDKIEFADGTVWDFNKVLNDIAVTRPTGVIRSVTSGTLTGTGGNDSLEMRGSGVLDGGTGDDTLTATSASVNCIFHIDRNDGLDVIRNSASNGVIEFGADILPSDLVVRRDGSALIFKMINSANELRIESYFYNEASPTIGEIRFAGGTVWTPATIKNMLPLDGSLSNDEGLLGLWGYSGADVLNGRDEDDHMWGYAGNDTLNGKGGVDEMYGGDGNDTLLGGVENDKLDGGDGDDILQGQAGNDEVYGGGGSDIVDGGAGNDILIGGAGNDTFLFGRNSGQDSLYVSTSYPTERDILQLGADIAPGDLVMSRSANDLIMRIRGTDDILKLVDYFSDSLGEQILQIKFNGGGVLDINTIRNAVIVASDGDDQIWGYDTNDVLSGLIGEDELYGGLGNDTLNGGVGDDVLYADVGDDTLNGGGQNDALNGGGGNDTLIGGDGDDVLMGDRSLSGTLSPGNDILNGGAGKDTLDGEEGNDTLDGGSGADTLFGGDGNDIYIVDNVLDTVTEYNGSASGGLDEVRSRVTFTLDQYLENLTLTGAAAINGTGNSLDNIIVGNTGNNVIIGGAGNDTLTGGNGNDTFRFNTALHGTDNVDAIVDFSVSKDVIQLDKAIFTKLSTAGALKTLNFAANALGTAVDSNDYILYSSDTGRLYYDADGNGSGAKMLFAVIGGSTHPALTAGDIVVI